MIAYLSSHWFVLVAEAYIGELSQCGQEICTEILDLKMWNYITGVRKSGNERKVQENSKNVKK